jgi:hypothetical protein
VVLVAVVEVYTHRLNGAERALLAAAPRAASEAGCGPVRTVPPYPRDLDRTHIGAPEARVMPPLASYPSIPPASGPHGSVPLDAGVYATPPPIDRAIHSLEHAAVIVWYDAGAASQPEIQRIRAFFARGDEQNHVIVAPYRYPAQGPAGALPAGVQMALVAWHHVETCRQPSLAVAYAFVHAYRFNLYQYGAYRGDAPEKFLSI